ncbi:TatD family hydrolase [Priestia endophytica]|uniref:TatD family hydrolase n=1 Tax=Priestia endophytica TaxID=135735 RepID=UPI000DCA4DC8|nr:TatD family hydrolase [Priestia endophytica]RAS81079.1 TatD family deoxyribonuclease [Priestia endophytica]
MIDAHLHLAEYSNILERIKHWQDYGITGVVAVSTDLASSYRILELKSRYPNFIIAAAGFHPEHPLPSSRDLHEWHDLIDHETSHFSAIGEVGMPQYREDAFHPYVKKQYEALFLEMVQTAKMYHLPLLLHAVHMGAPLVYRHLQAHKIKKAHFHWFKGDEQTMQHIINAGYYVSVTPEVCYRKRDQELVKRIPLSQLLLETDGPWPFQERFAHCETSPLLLPHVEKTVSSLKSIDPILLRDQIKHNIKNLFSMKA